MNTKRKYLVIDTETGGLNDRKHSILEIAGVIWTPEEEPKKLFEFLIKENKIIAEQEALNINNINLNEVKEKGLAPKTAVGVIKHYLDKEFGKNRRPIILAGHNVGFDVNFLKRLYEQANELDSYYADFASRVFDSNTVFDFLIISGCISEMKSHSRNLFRYTGINIPKEQRHRAMGDAYATAQALSVLFNRIKG